MEALKLLYWGRAVARAGERIRGHSHDYWQSNWGLQGTCRITLPTQTLTLGKGQILFLPPGLRHELHYPEDFLCLSFKFSVAAERCDRMILLDESPLTAGAIAGAEGMIAKTFPPALIGVPEGAVIMPGDQYHFLLEHLIRGVFDKAFERTEEHKGLSGELEQLVRRKNGSVSVEEAARSCGYSRNHFSLLIRKETGLSAKEFIDRERVTMAKRYLRYSHATISEIADIMGFASLFYFSGFFRRMTGISPGKYRKQNLS